MIDARADELSCNSGMSAHRRSIDDMDIYRVFDIKTLDLPDRACARQLLIRVACEV